MQLGLPLAGRAAPGHASAACLDTDAGRGGQDPLVADIALLACIQRVHGWLGACWHNKPSAQTCMPPVAGGSATPYPLETHTWSSAYCLHQKENTRGVQRVSGPALRGEGLSSNGHACCTSPPPWLAACSTHTAGSRSGRRCSQWRPPAKRAGRKRGQGDERACQGMPRHHDDRGWGSGSARGLRFSCTAACR